MNPIKTKRCLLKLIVKDDLSLFRKLQIDPKVRQFLGGPVDLNAIDAKFDSYLNARLPTHHLSVTLVQGETIGLVSLEKYGESSDFEMSYQFLPSCWGKGLAFEAICSVMDYAQLKLKPASIFAETQSKNLSSIQLLEKLGMDPIEEITRFGERQIVYSTSFNMT